MKYHELKSTRQKAAKRVGRGIAAGQGKTAGRGTKGYGSRTGSKAKPGFSGGQNPLMQQLPKLPGFRSFRTPHENVYTGQLDQFSGKTVDAEVLATAGLISSPFVNVKLISKGDVTKKVTVQLQAASASAVEALQTAGGSFEKTTRTPRPTTSANPKKIDNVRKPQKHANKK